MSSIWTKYWVTGLLVLAGMVSRSAETYELLDGQTINGPPLSITKDGVAFRDATGSQGPRIGYTNMSQQALRELEKNPKAKRFVEPFLELPMDASNSVGGRVELKQFERLEQPNPKGGLSQMVDSPLGWSFLLLLMAANLYSAFEVGVFRNYQPFMVAGIALVLPILTQIIFLCLPTYVAKSAETVVDATSAHVPGFTTAGGGTPGKSSGGAEEAAHAVPGAPALPHFKRGEFTFNKRFFETKLSGFFGMRPSDAEKGMVFEVKSNRGTLLCNRIVRATPAELALQVLRGSTIEEVSLPYSDVVEIQVKNRSH